ncbi:type II toxin-antitoxin system YafQ family toxin [Candidatus Microgenomates bacterium]|nr:type II toxin-antitoxin system YafQ family toxin [Candidatus Microgenomates bacterium]
MKIYYHRRFLKHYKKRIFPSSSLSKRFSERLSLFMVDSDNEILKDHPLTGDLEDYRAFSITGDIRAVYYIENNEIHLYDIGTHNQVYK